jgi:2-desacetyl-2-hydroxyethyl bacteriochlorophyllide A dehydrogenase
VKALEISRPNWIDLVERPVPRIGPEEALIRVAAAGLCHTDLYALRGQNPAVRYPIVPGHEFSGVVEACGPAVRAARPGDPVTVMTILACGHCRHCRQGRTTVCQNYAELGSQRDGGFGEYVAAPARSLVPIDDLGLPQAAMAEPAANAYSAVRHACIEPGDRVAVIGPGPVGLLALQVARLAQPRDLILLGTRDARLDVGARLGATHLLNVQREDPVGAVHELTDGQGVDVVLRCAGTASATELALQIAATSARVALEGVTAGRETVALAPDALVFRRLTLIGVRGWSEHEFATAVELMKLGAVDAKPLLTHRFGLEEHRAAYRVLDEAKDEVIKAQFIR